MNIIIEVADHQFFATLNHNQVAQAVAAQLPQTLNMVRSDKHEYYARLNTTIEAVEKGTDHVLPNHIYYFDGFNALSLNFSAKQIAPFQVIEVGTFDPLLNQILQEADEHLPIKIKQSEE